VDLSQIYLDARKDCLYTFAADHPARRSAQTALYQLAQALTRLAAPILSHTSEEVWEQLKKMEALPESVQLADWPDLAGWKDAALGEKWSQLLALKDKVSQALEEAKSQGVIRQPLDARVILELPPEEKNLGASLGEAGLAALFVVSQVSIGEGEGNVKVLPVEGEKCPRCWLRLPTIGQAADHPELCHRCVEAVKNGPQ
jgi:isoleucyl-tRNA synthetase